MGKYIKKQSNFIYGHEFKFLVKQTNEEVHSSSLNLDEKVQKVTNLLIHVSNKCLRAIKIKKKKSKNHEYFNSNCYNKRKELQMLANLLEKNADNLTSKQNVSIKV